VIPPLVSFGLSAVVFRDTPVAEPTMETKLESVGAATERSVDHWQPGMTCGDPRFDAPMALLSTLVAERNRRPPGCITSERFI